MRKTLNLIFKKILYPGVLPYKENRGAHRTRLKVQKAVLVSLRVFSLERSTAGAFAVPFRELNRKKYDRCIYIGNSQLFDKSSHSVVIAVKNYESIS